MKEKMPGGESRETRLEIEYRNPLQILLMGKMLGENVSDNKSQMEWVEEHGREVSEIIDAPEHEDIRAVARKGDFDEAASMVLEALNRNMKKAA